MKFILSRTKDNEIHSKQWIVGYGLLFWLVTRILSVLLLLACCAIYNRFGIEPEQLTKFGGDPTNVRSIFSVGYGILMILVIAPLLEECIFRLGLSFKKWQIAIAFAAIPTYLLFQEISILSLTKGSLLAVCAIAFYCLIYFLTSNAFWNKLKHKYFQTSVWITSILFGLMHLMAFSTFNLTLLPYMLCVISVPFFAGCVITYYRVNLGFWWGVGLHVFNNLPGIFMIASI